MAAKYLFRQPHLSRECMSGVSTPPRSVPQVCSIIYQPRCCRGFVGRPSALAPGPSRRCLAPQVREQLTRLLADVRHDPPRLWGGAAAEKTERGGRCEEGEGGRPVRSPKGQPRWCVLEGRPSASLPASSRPRFDPRLLHERPSHLLADVRHDPPRLWGRAAAEKTERGGRWDEGEGGRPMRSPNGQPRCCVLEGRPSASLPASSRPRFDPRLLHELPSHSLADGGQDSPVVASR
jgi:hypothetical protein